MNKIIYCIVCVMISIPTSICIIHNSGGSVFGILTSMFVNFVLTTIFCVMLGYFKLLDENANNEAEFILNMMYKGFGFIIRNVIKISPLILIIVHTLVLTYYINDFLKDRANYVAMLNYVTSLSLWLLILVHNMKHDTKKKNFRRFNLFQIHNYIPGNEGETICPVCHDDLTNIVYKTECYHVFCQTCIIKCLTKSNLCPICRKVLSK